MNILSIKYSKLCNYDIVYSKNISRPSKTLVDPNVYNLYNLVKLDPYSDLKDEILIECLNYFNDDFILDNNSDNYNCNEDYILVQNNNLYEIYNFISSCNLNINTIIHINDIYNYPKIQLIKLLSMIFSDVKISVSNYKNSGLICCTNKIYNINPCKNFNIKDFNIKVDEYIINFFYDYNLRYLKKIIYINNIIQDKAPDIIYNELYFINNYIKKYINKNTSKCECIDFHIGNFGKYIICKKCFSITLCDHFFERQASDADLNAFL